jgi:DNA-binding XRE family transcriptional regulator
MEYEGTKQKGKVAIAGGKELRFEDLFDLTITALNKVWILSDVTPTVLRFRPRRPFWHAKQGVPVGVILRAWRKQKGFSQAKAAKALGISMSLVQKVEQGRRRLSSKTLDQILQSAVGPLYTRAKKGKLVRIL